MFEKRIKKLTVKHELAKKMIELPVSISIISHK